MATNKKKQPAKADVARRNNGRFLKGTSGNPKGGNSATRHNKALKAAFDKAITEEDIKAVVAKMILQARKGDAAARRDMFDRLWGRPAQPIVGDEGLPIEIIISERKPKK
jgi:hypothetical protein